MEDAFGELVDEFAARRFFVLRHIVVPDPVTVVKHDAFAP
jgi:hypothetical protein